MDRMLTTADRLLPDLAAQYRSMPKKEALRAYLVSQGFARAPKDLQ